MTTPHTVTSDHSERRIALPSILLTENTEPRQARRRKTFSVDAALRIVERLALTVPAFTTDDVWNELTTPGDGREIANAIIRAHDLGLIRNSNVGVYMRGHQEHKRWLSIWLSVALKASDETALIYARIHR